MLSPKDSAIVNSAVFINLSGKTQMIRNSGTYSDFTNRGKHSLQVRDNALLISALPIFQGRNIQINTDLLSTMCLLHDVGHTPFGHAGEEAINDLFLSTDKIHYSESHPGVFKHSINSIRLILQRFEKWGTDNALIDGIVKHTSPFPKNYCSALFPDQNVVKMNFLFRSLYFNKNEGILLSFSQFLSSSPTCSASSHNCIGDSRFKHYCPNHKSICFLSCDPDEENQLANRYHDRDFPLLSAYLSYPYALTYEGAILFWSDEISCFLSDFLDFSKYVVEFVKDSTLFIPLTRLANCLELLLSSLPAGSKAFSIVSNLSCILKVLTEPGDSKEKIRSVTNFLSNVKKILFSSLVLNEAQEFSGFYFSTFCIDSHRYCQSLLSLEKNCAMVMRSVKEAIYSDLHSLRYIEETNRIGSKMLVDLIMFFARHLDSFSKEYKRLFPSSDLVEQIGRGVASMSEPRVPDAELASFLKAFENSFTKHYKQYSRIILGKRKTFPKSIIRKFKNKTISTSQMGNLIKREISYFVASLPEEKVLLLLISYGRYKKDPLPVL